MPQYDVRVSKMVLQPLPEVCAEQDQNISAEGVPKQCGEPTVSTQMVLFSTNVPGAPNRTIPPSVGELIRLFLTFELAQDIEMPSAH